MPAISGSGGQQEAVDVRGPLLAAGAWAGGLASADWWWGALALTAGALLVGLLRGLRSSWPVLALALLLGSVVVSVGMWRSTVATDDAVLTPARERAIVSGEVEVTGDPRELERGRVVVAVALRHWQVRGRVHQGRVPAVVWGGREWMVPALGERWQVEGRLAYREGEVSLTARGVPHLLSNADLGWRVAAAVRAGIRRASGVSTGRDEVPRGGVQDARPRAPLDAGPWSGAADDVSAWAQGRALVPALVDGDDSALAEEAVTDFRTVGLTHLLAVSGSNLTVVLVCLMAIGRACGVRGRWSVVLGLAGVVAFVLLARGEPSVLRAAVTGAIGVVALGHRGRHRAVAVLSTCVVVLLLVDPALASRAGFALSVLATAAIVLLAPGWTALLEPHVARLPGSRWLAWLPAAVAVPLAAQVVCTPVVAVVSGQVSWVAVGANLAAAPVVGPVTVLGLFGGVLALVWEPVGQVVAWPAVAGAWWIVQVATRCAQLPGAASSVGSGVLVWLLVTMVCGTLARWGVPWVLSRGRRVLACLVALVGLVGVRWPTPGWPPAQWAVAACDVGQGDALLVRSGPGEAVMVDVGPDPRAAERCLRRFGIDRVPLLVLTHFDADHVDGLHGVVDRVERLETSAVALPPQGAAQVRRVAGTRAPPNVASVGTRRVGQVTVQVLTDGTGGTNPNDASVVVLARVDTAHGALTALFTGDLGRTAQQPIRRLLGATRVDVLKVAHHGSKDTDLAWLEALAPPMALVSVGADNTYGHPAPAVLAALRGTAVGRTDTDGDLAVVPGSTGWRLVRAG